MEANKSGEQGLYRGSGSRPICGQIGARRRQAAGVVKAAEHHGTEQATPP
jgi:hypothetical protein